MKTLTKRANVFLGILFCLTLVLSAVIGLSPVSSTVRADDAAEDISTKLLHQWEVENTTSLDSTSGAGKASKTLTANGTVTNVDGVGTGGLRFATGAYVYATGGLDLPQDAEAVTFSFFHRFEGPFSNANGWPALLSFVGSSKAYRLCNGFEMQDGNGSITGWKANYLSAELGVKFSNNGQWDMYVNNDTSTGYTAGSYMHVTIQIDKTGIRGYRDGVLKATLSQTNATVRDAIGVALEACNSGTVGFLATTDGRTACIDDIRVYDGLVDPAEIYRDSLSALISSVTIDGRTVELTVTDWQACKTLDEVIVIADATDRWKNKPTITAAAAEGVTVVDNWDDIKDTEGEPDGSTDGIGRLYALRFTATSATGKKCTVEVPIHLLNAETSASLLSDIRIDGVSIDGFDFGNTEYAYYLGPDAVRLPTVTAVPMSDEVEAVAVDTSDWTVGQDKYTYTVSLRKKDGSPVGGNPYKIDFLSSQSVLCGQEVFDQTWSTASSSDKRGKISTPSGLSGARTTQNVDSLTVQGGAGIISNTAGISSFFAQNGVNNGIFGASNKGVTINAWMRFPSSVKQVTEAAVMTVYGDGKSIDVRFNGGFSIKSGNTITAEDFEDTRLATGTWRLLSLIIKPDNAYFYIDGVQAYTAENGDVKGLVNWNNILTGGISDIRLGCSFRGNSDGALRADIRAVQTYKAPLGETALRGIAAAVKNTGIDTASIALAATGESTFATDDSIEGYAQAAATGFADFADENAVYVTEDDAGNIGIYISSTKRDADVAGLASFPSLTVQKKIGVGADATATEKLTFVSTRTTDGTNEYAYDVSGRTLTWTVVSKYAPNGDEDRLYRKNYTVTVQYCSPDTALKSLSVDGVAIDLTSNAFSVREGQNLGELNIVATPADAGSECIVDVDAAEGRVSVRVLSEFGGKMSAAASSTYTIYRFAVNEASNNNYLSSVSVDGITVTGFDRKKTEYTVGVPYGSNLYNLDIQATTEDRNASVSQPVYDEMTRSATLTVTSAYGETRAYTFRFVDMSDVTALNSIMIDGEVLAGFDPNVTDYTVTVDSLDKVKDMRITANPKSSGAVAYVKVESDGSYATVTVTAETGSVEMYVIRFTTETTAAVQESGCGSTVTPVASLFGLLLIVAAAVFVGKKRVRRNG